MKRLSGTRIPFTDCAGMLISSLRRFGDGTAGHVNCRKIKSAIWLFPERITSVCASGSQGRTGNSAIRKSRGTRHLRNSQKSRNPPGKPVVSTLQELKRSVMRQLRINSLLTKLPSRISGNFSGRLHAFGFSSSGTRGGITLTIPKSSIISTMVAFQKISF